jgi:general secretion pathway protein E/type IV pilus assembly protein PilB
LGLDPGLISDALLGIVGQRLVRKICPHCAEPYRPTPEDLRKLGLNWEEANPQAWQQGKGCSACFNSGFLGRQAIVELLDVDDTVRQIIYEGSMMELQRYLNEIDFVSFRVAAVEKVTQGITTPTEVLRVLPHSALYRRSSRQVAPIQNSNLSIQN